jgi:hypothetical protein
LFLCGRFAAPPNWKTGVDASAASGLALDQNFAATLRDNAMHSSEA